MTSLDKWDAVIWQVNHIVHVAQVASSLSLGFYLDILGAELVFSASLCEGVWPLLNCVLWSRELFGVEFSSQLLFLFLVSWVGRTGTVSGTPSADSCLDRFGEQVAMCTPHFPFTWWYCGSVLPGLDLDPGLFSLEDWFHQVNSWPWITEME